ncbi:septum formation protein Maf [Candidatus Woesearchaeota archaeon]|nr:septum formation protein Maf [Candidatus Woesearchaeota archaeon]
MKQIILASASPRRKYLMKRLFKKFIVYKSSYDEDNNLPLSPVKLALYHSLEKGKNVAKHFKSGIVISADTIVVYNNKVMGKPSSKENAKEMLRLISGKEHEVITAFAVIDIDKNKIIQDYDASKVKMRILTDKEINDYINYEKPFDHAGAYAIQGKAAVFVEKIEGDYFNVVGLPLFKLNNVLKKLGVDIFKV